MVPRSDVVDLDMTIEEAFRLVVSGGVLVPGSNGNGAWGVRPAGADTVQEPRGD